MPHDHARPDYLTLEFPEAPAGRPYVLLNMVMSADGRTVIEGNERGLGSPSDQFLMRALRTHADAVLNGAATLRASGTSADLGRDDLRALRAARGKPALPLACVVTNTGNVPLERKFFSTREYEGVVFAGLGVPADRRAAMAATGRQVVDLPAEAPLPWLLGWLRRERDVRLLLLEGGALLNGALFDLDAIDEFFLTLSPTIVGGDGPLGAAHMPRPATVRETKRLALLSAVSNPATDEVYLRYRVQRA